MSNITNPFNEFEKILTDLLIDQITKDTPYHYHRNPEPPKEIFTVNQAYIMDSKKDLDGYMEYARVSGVPFCGDMLQKIKEGTYDYKAYPNLSWCTHCNSICGLKHKDDCSHADLFQWLTGNTFMEKCDAYKAHFAIKEEELKTFEDCWEKVRTFNRVKLNISLPNLEIAEMISAAGKCAIIWRAINGDWKPDNEIPAHYIVYSTSKKLISTVSNLQLNPFPFKSKEDAQKAIDIDKSLWLKLLNK